MQPPQGDQRCGSRVSQVSSGFAVAAACWQPKVQAARPHSKELGHSRQLAASPAPRRRLPTWWQNSGCPILWDDYRHGGPPLQHNADTLKRGFFHSQDQPGNRPLPLGHSIQHLGAIARTDLTYGKSQLELNASKKPILRLNSWSHSAPGLLFRATYQPFMKSTAVT